MARKSFIDAFRERMTKSAGGDVVPGRFWTVSVPAPRPPPRSWRRRAVMRGPYTRFSLSLPHDWAELPGAQDMLRVTPSYDDDTRLTLAAHPLAVSGPQGLLEAAETVLGVPPAPAKSVRLARWGDDGWAASWGWETAGDFLRILALGNDQGVVVVTVECAGEAVDEVVEGILGSLELPPAEIWAPEFFPMALVQLLNDRAGDLLGGAWHIDDEGFVVGGNLRIQPFNVYRAYLQDGDLEAIAEQLDARAQKPPGSEWTDLAWEEVQEYLRVVLRPLSAVEGIDIVQVPVAPGLAACPVLDSADRITFIPTSEATRWGLDARALLSWAVARQDASGAHWIELRDDADLLRGVQLSAEGYDSGLLLCPSMRLALEEELGSPLLVAMPAAECIHVWRDTAEARDHLARRTDSNYRRRPRPLSKELWLWTEEGLFPVRA